MQDRVKRKRIGVYEAAKESLLTVTGIRPELEELIHLRLAIRRISSDMIAMSMEMESLKSRYRDLHEYAVLLEKTHLRIINRGSRAMNRTRKP